MTHEEMVLGYEKVSATATYIIGYAVKHKLYMNLINGFPAEYTTTEEVNRGQGTNLRLRIRKAHKEALLPKGIFLGEESLLTDTKYNKGEMFEKLVTEYFGQVWKKDNIPFTVQGDINVNGVEIQIKYNSATFCNSKQLMRLVG